MVEEPTFSKEHVYVGIGDYEVSFSYDVPASVVVEWISDTGVIYGPKILGVDYSIVTVSSVAYIRVLLNYGTGGRLFIRRELPLTQTFNFVDGEEPAPSAIMRAIDRIVWMCQQISSGVNGALRTPLTENLDMTIPPISERADSIHGYDSSGLPIAFASVPSAATSTYMESGLISANEAAFKAYYNVNNVEDVTAGEAISSGDPVGYVDGAWVKSQFKVDSTTTKAGTGSSSGICEYIGNGHVLIGFTDTNGAQLMVLGYDAGALTEELTSFTVVHATAVAYSMKLCRLSDDHFVVAYQRGSALYVRIGHYDTGAITWDTSETLVLANGSGVGQYTLARITETGDHFVFIYTNTDIYGRVGELDGSSIDWHVGETYLINASTLGYYEAVWTGNEGSNIEGIDLIACETSIESFILFHITNNTSSDTLTNEQEFGMDVLPVTPTNISGCSRIQSLGNDYYAVVLPYLSAYSETIAILSVYHHKYVSADSEGPFIPVASINLTAINNSTSTNATTEYSLTFVPESNLLVVNFMVDGHMKAMVYKFDSSGVNLLAVVPVADIYALYFSGMDRIGVDGMIVAISSQTGGTGYEANAIQLPVFDGVAIEAVASGETFAVQRTGAVPVSVLRARAVCSVDYLTGDIVTDIPGERIGRTLTTESVLLD